MNLEESIKALQEKNKELEFELAAHKKALEYAAMSGLDLKDPNHHLVIGLAESWVRYARHELKK